jgi:hypothetical protein
MAEDNRPEVNLEICSGFFRIPTNELIYNIKVLPSSESTTTKVIEKIIEVEKKAAPAVTAPPPEPETKAPASEPEPATTPPTDDYYQQAATKFCANFTNYRDADSSSEQQSSSINGLNDLAQMASELKDVLNGVKSNSLPTPTSGDSDSNNLATGLKSIFSQISQAKKLIGGKANETPPVPAKEKPKPKSAPEKHTRYLFNFDAVFQTIYELCTNETVKEHVQKARAKAEDIFSKDKFYDALSPKVAELQEDDGFFTIPMSDIFNSLSTACSDKNTCNLLKKMDQQQADIFLDQFLPLEAPPTEEIEIPGETAAEDTEPVASNDSPDSSAADQGGISDILNNIEKELKALQANEQDADSGDTCNPENLADGIDNAINIAVSISYDAEQIANIAKIDGQFHLLPVQTEIVFMENILAQKESNPALSFADGAAKAKDAAEEFNSQEKAKLEDLLAPEEDEDDSDDDDSGEVGQDEIDKLLEEMG